MGQKVPLTGAGAPRTNSFARWPLQLALAAGASLLAACTTTSLQEPARVPVVDKSSGGKAAGKPVPEAATAAAAAPLPGQENAGKPGYHTVRPGETLIRIGLDNGQNWRDIVRWNNLENPNLIEVGQVLRVAPPSANGVAIPAGSVAASAPVGNAAPDSRVQARSLASAGSASAAAAPNKAADSAAGEAIAFSWPSSGSVIERFDETRNKGVDIAGKAGDPVLAAADGRVVYAGSGLRGYGNLIILKHNNTFLTAYAHNQALLVKEDQNVRQGQKIAEMGNSDADRVKLHFEVRRQGKPVDPLKHLPAR
ncbi:MAG: hypothetical protein RJA36_195 [Pseudomonadota bacterium]|jgi:lipoprotein NlpD